jgi:purine nucleosidase
MERIGRRRVVIDTDPGVDDYLAIALLAASPEIEIVAVGSVQGNVQADMAAANALRVLDVLGLTHVPVAVGGRPPIASELSLQQVHGHDGLGGRAGPPSARTVSRESAAEQLVRLAREEPGELTLLALGPLTNVAQALRSEPRLPSLLQHVVLMGGAIRVPGNAGPCAEANVANDPEAADVVLRAGFAGTMVPLDATRQVWAGAAWLDALEALQTWPARYAKAVMAGYVRRYSDVYGQRGCVPHDAVAAAVLLDPSSAVLEEHSVTVELRGSVTRGQTVADLRPGQRSRAIDDGRPAIQVATRVDGERVLSRLLDALSLTDHPAATVGGRPSEIDSEGAI